TTYGANDLVLTAHGGVTHHAPIAVDDTATTVTNAAVTIPVLANDSDPDNRPLTVQSIDTTGAAGQVLIDPGNQTVTYTPPAGFAGTDTFHYTITDGQGTATAAVTVTVNAADLQVTGLTVPSGVLLGSP